jgi:hypothetical protein
MVGVTLTPMALKHLHSVQKLRSLRLAHRRSWTDAGVQLPSCSKTPSQPFSQTPLAYFCGIFPSLKALSVTLITFHAFRATELFSRINCLARPGSHQLRFLGPVKITCHASKSEEKPLRGRGPDSVLEMSFLLRTNFRALHSTCAPKVSVLSGAQPRT